jgi:hypothetical protein
MSRRSGGSGAVIALLIVAILAGVGYMYRDQVMALWGGSENATEASPEVAAEAQEKLDQLRAGGDSVRLSGVEITSLLRYRSPAAMLQMIHDPTVQIVGDTLRLTGMVPTDRLPADPNLDRIRLLLPDTAKVSVRGTLQASGGGEAAFGVEGVEFAGVPIPPRYYSMMLERLGRRDRPGLDPGAVSFRLPARVATARVADGFLVLTPAVR